MNTLGRTLASRRSQLGLTLRMLSADVDVSIGHLSDIENDRTLPSTPLLQRLGARLKLDLAMLQELRPRLTAQELRWIAAHPEARAEVRRWIDAEEVRGFVAGWVAAAAALAGTDADGGVKELLLAVGGSVALGVATERDRERLTPYVERLS